MTQIVRSLVVYNPSCKHSYIARLGGGGGGGGAARE